jgi:hypothetical protein
MTTVNGWEWPYAKLLDVHDGDTVQLSIDNGFGSRAVEWIRLLDVWCPELRDPGGPEATQATTDWWTRHAPDGAVKVTTYRVGQLELRFRRSFTRYIGTVTSLAGAELNRYLVGLGYTT